VKKSSSTISRALLQLKRLSYDSL